ncbi:hypothetical protein [Arthrobacter sp. STN4]|uniref:hypothetical protein n=1 Tax=Arthrobacter sp. STN4 TaxID=2923276 RepID=UPI00211A8DA5|nr:hypothetical protein [Arthrobacter sp. STN4]MCQ9163978.1 hypothetical protein [Arthrobacter sp. STN4]
MPANHSIHASGDRKGRAESSLTCTNCETDEYLIVESIQPHIPRTSGLVSLEYECRSCGAFFAHDASVQDVAKLLANQPGRAGVLHFGRYYIHCGEPMEKGEIRFSTHHPRDGEPADVKATFPSVVLRCQCGFQMSIPAD